MALLELIDSLDSNIRFKTPLISIENQLILVHSRICWIAEAQKIIKDPERARHILGFHFSDERVRLATEFQARFPNFAGYRLIAKEWGRLIQLELIDGPSEADTEGIPPREILKNEADEFLRWELRKIRMEMVFEIAISQGSRKLFYFEIITKNFEK